MALLSLSRVENGKRRFNDRRQYDLPRSRGTPDRAAIEALARAGILSGRGDGTFDPDATMTRAEFAALVVRRWGKARVCRSFQGCAKGRVVRGLRRRGI